MGEAKRLDMPHSMSQNKTKGYKCDIIDKGILYKLTSYLKKIDTHCLIY